MTVDKRLAQLDDRITSVQIYGERRGLSCKHRHFAAMVFVALPAWFMSAAALLWLTCK